MIYGSSEAHQVLQRRDLPQDICQLKAEVVNRGFVVLRLGLMLCSQLHNLAFQLRAVKLLLLGCLLRLLQALYTHSSLGI